MKPVFMTVKHDPDNGTFGDCFRCCIASLLELPACDVPHFMGEGYKDGHTLLNAVNDFLKPLGLCYYAISQTEPWHWEAWLDSGWNPYYIWSGRSPRADHSVVARAGKMVHDPHHEGKGLVGPFDDGSYSYAFLMAICGEKDGDQ